MGSIESFPERWLINFGIIFIFNHEIPLSAKLSSEIVGAAEEGVHRRNMTASGHLRKWQAVPGASAPAGTADEITKSGPSRIDREIRIAGDS